MIELGAEPQNRVSRENQSIAPHTWITVGVIETATLESGDYGRKDNCTQVLFLAPSRVPHICMILADVGELEPQICERRADVRPHDLVGV
jgi:hypothetical protein